MVQLVVSNDSITLSLSTLEKFLSMDYHCNNDVLTYPLSMITTCKSYKNISTHAIGIRLFGSSIPGKIFSIQRKMLTKVIIIL